MTRPRRSELKFFGTRARRAGCCLKVGRAATLLLALAAAAGAHAQCDPPDARATRTPDAAQMNEAEALYLPTPHHAVEAMLRLAQVSARDVVYDLGSGDGRIPIAAARTHGARAVGIELDGRMIRRARCNALEAKVSNLVEFRQGDLFLVNLREATVVTLFLFPEMNQRLLPKLLAELRPGARIVSHRFGLGDWAPQQKIEAGGNPVFMWTVPAAGAPPPGKAD